MPVPRYLFTFPICLFAACALVAQEPPVTTVRVDATPSHILNSFDPDQSLGSSVDALSRSGIDKMYTPHIIQESLSAGWGPLTYRNNTELRVAAWHWNEDGVWSDPAHKSGYFTSSSEPKEMVRYILAYSLPHRGFTHSGGGASSTLSGAVTSYWKSNPYLTSRFTGEPDASHPQWVVVDLGAEKPVSTIRIDWAAPYATSYDVDYWTGKNALSKNPQGQWTTFPSGAVKGAAGGAATLRLAETPINTRYVRIWMTSSSNTCDEHGSEDIRNCVGYAIRDIRVDGAGDKLDFTTSSVDPWHSAADVENGDRYAHTGFDLLFTSGITNGLPAMIPVTMLYGTPEDSAAQIAYLKKRGYPVGWIEMGEEPDGKNILPEDYAALYLQWAAAIHKVDPSMKLGGPIFEGVNQDIKVWPDSKGRTSWMGRFVDYLREHGRLADLAFVSFEHYPFEPCDITWKSLYREPELMKNILKVWRDDGVPKNVPLMVTESHIAWQLTGPMSQIFAALWLVDNIGSFFEGGGAAFYHSPIQPQGIDPSCLGSASWSNFVSDNDYNIKGYTSLYFAAHLINREWAQHRSGVHRMFPSVADLKDGDGNLLVTSYALKRLDGEWAVMLVNRDESNPHAVRIAWEDESGRKRGAFSGPVRMTTFGSEQYVWHDAGANSYADPDGPPLASFESGKTYTLPKASVTVLRGRVDGF